MGKETLKDKIKEWYWTQMRKLMNYTLKNHGCDFGKHYMEELLTMYMKHKDEIDRT